MEFGGSIIGRVNISSPPPTGDGGGVCDGIEPVFSDKIMNYDKNDNSSIKSDDNISPTKKVQNEKNENKKNEKIQNEKIQEDKLNDKSKKKIPDIGDGINKIKTEKINEIKPKNGNSKVDINNPESEPKINDKDDIKDSCKEDDKVIDEMDIDKAIEDSNIHITNGSKDAISNKDNEKSLSRQNSENKHLDGKLNDTDFKYEEYKTDSKNDSKTDDTADSNNKDSDIIKDDNDSHINNAANSIQTFLKGKNDLKKAKGIDEALKLKEEEKKARGSLEKGAATSIQNFFKGKNNEKKAKVAADEALKLNLKKEASASSIQSFLKGKNEIKKAKSIVDFKRSNSDDRKAKEEVQRALKLKEEEQKGAANSIQSFLKGKNEIKKAKNIVDLKRSDMKQNQEKLNTGNNVDSSI
jgi:hypothetical protein